MKPLCNRCNKSINDICISVFNNEKICHECQILEIDHIQFDQAKEALQAAISSGDYEFTGIGLPSDLIQKI